MPTIEVIQRVNQVVVQPATPSLAVMSPMSRPKVEVMQRVNQVLAQPILRTLAVASPGPQGPPGSGSGGDSDFTLVPAGITLGSGRFLHVLPDGTAVYADASVGREAHGYTREAVTAGDDVKLRSAGELSGLSGLTPGSTYFLSDLTPGFYTATPPASGLVQRLGVATVADLLLVEIEPALIAL